MPVAVQFYFLAGVAGFLTTLVSVPFWRSISRRFGLVDAPGQRKIHQAPIPLAGGLAVLTGILLPLLTLSALVYWRWLPGWPAPAESARISLSGQNWLADGFARRQGQLLGILLGALGMTILGLWDDKHELRAAPKFIGQFLIALLTAAAGLRITLFIANPIFSYAITILWILTVTNAFNFMDNMNGLCAGLGALATCFIGVQAMSQVHYLVAGLAFLTCGALVGFLPFNFPRATVFLGDSGSHLVGYLLSVLTILPHFYSAQHQRPWAVLTPLFLLALPLADLAWVVLLRWRMGQPFYVGDTNHLSHRLVRRGLSPVRAVLLILLSSLLISTAALLWS